MRRHLLVTNDFPPKVGGIQAYLWELWRRLPGDELMVLTTPHADATPFDAEQPFAVVRSREPWMLPHPAMVRWVRDHARRFGAELVIVDPAVPLGGIGPRLGLPYGVVLHGAEVTVPGRLPVSGPVLGSILRQADLVIAAGGYPLAEGERAAGRELPAIVIPPGVDTSRFRPLDPARRDEVRAAHGIGPDDVLLHAGSRLVPRKGIDVVLQAADRLADELPSLKVIVSGTGRDRYRLELMASAGRVPVRFTGRLPLDDLVDLYGAADVFSMLCRTRWGGLEQEGFGIVFLEAAACGTPQVAGRSGGAHEAVAHDRSGLIVDDPLDVDEATAALRRVLTDDVLRSRLAAGSIEQARAHDYDLLAARLQDFLG